MRVWHYDQASSVAIQDNFISSSEVDAIRVSGDAGQASPVGNRIQELPVGHLPEYHLF